MNDTDDTDILTAERVEASAETPPPQPERPRRRTVELTPEEERVCDMATD